MNVPQLYIQQTRGQISIEQDHGGVAIQQSPAEVTMNIDPPAIVIERTRGELEIDQSQALFAYGITDPLTLTNQIATQARQQALETIAKIANDGDRMANVHQSDQVIVELAKEIPQERPPIRFTDHASHHNVHFSYTPDELDIDGLEGTVDMEVRTHPPIIERIPAQVQIGMLQYPTIQIDWIEPQVDQKA